MEEARWWPRRPIGAIILVAPRRSVGSLSSVLCRPLLGLPGLLLGPGCVGCFQFVYGIAFAFECGRGREDSAIEPYARFAVVPALGARAIGHLGPHRVSLAGLAWFCRLPPWCATRGGARCDCVDVLGFYMCADPGGFVDSFMFASSASCLASAPSCLAPMVAASTCLQTLAVCSIPSGPALSGACLASKHACPVLRDSHFADAADAGAPRVREARTPLAPKKFTFVHVDVFRSGPRRIGGAKWARKSVSGANCVVARAQLLSASQLEHEPVRLPCLAPSGLGGVLTLRRGLLLPRASRS